MSWLVLAVFLYVACAALIFAEVFVPSGGIISVLAFLCIGGGIAIFFYHSTTAGWVGVFVAGVMVPSLLVLAYKILPKTRFGRTVILAPSEREKGDAIPDTAELEELLGTVGEVVTPLRPVGICNISGKRIECVAESGYVDKDKKIKVIDVEGTQLTVRVVEEG